MKALLRIAGAALLALSALVPAVQAADAAPSLRPEVGKPLQQAQDLIKQKKFKEALAQADLAAQVPNPTPYERYIIARMRSAAANGAGDTATAIAALEAAIASGAMPAADQTAALQAIAGVAYGGKNYAKAAESVQKYRAAGGADAPTLALLPQALYLEAHYAEAAKEMSAQIAAQSAAGHKPSEDQLQLLASCAVKQNDNAGYLAALVQMTTYYPKDSYWEDLIARTAAKPGFSERLELDVFRLRRQTGTLTRPDDYVEAVELALQAGMTGEAQAYLDQGTQKGVLGKGAAADLDRQNRLKALVTRDLTQDKSTIAASAHEAAGQPTGDPLVNTGMDYIGFGQYDKGLPLMQQGLAKGGLKYPDLAQLRYGAALVQAGHREEAAKALAAVHGNDGTADLAKLWAIRAAAP
jgi:hypothetical protein